MYKHSSGAIVFGAGTVQWVWGLDTHHDTDSDVGSATPDPDMRQATLNLLADMGVQPATIQSGLIPGTATTGRSNETSRRRARSCSARRPRFVRSPDATTRSGRTRSTSAASACSTCGSSRVPVCRSETCRIRAVTSE